ncbi:MAG TPA: ribosome-associated translation inhibitor RaiA [Planctomycetaceae bacterium]|nr:ribosome-associated translation inhibitor RaiA [Planctomycetaceae bacterium]
MDVIFRGQHLTISDRFRQYATEHLGRIERHLPLADHAIVDVRREAKSGEGRFVVQVTISANGNYLRAEERNHDMEAAIDGVADVLDRQVKRFKERKLLRSERRVGKQERLPIQGDEPAEALLPPDTEIVAGKVVRIKHFQMKPMTEAEAIEQMELLGHNFFLFRDADRDELALVYKRSDNDYGLILEENVEPA